MKLSTKSRYALRSMIDLADAKGVMSIADISKNQNISIRYLELIFAKLKKADLITSIRGSHGGYQLGIRAEDISVFDVVHTMEQDASIVKKLKTSDRMETVLVDELWTPIDNHIEKYLKEIQLSSLLKNKL